VSTGVLGPCDRSFDPDRRCHEAPCHGLQALGDSPSSERCEWRTSQLRTISRRREKSPRSRDTLVASGIHDLLCRSGRRVRGPRCRHGELNVHDRWIRLRWFLCGVDLPCVQALQAGINERGAEIVVKRRPLRVAYRTFNDDAGVDGTHRETRPFFIPFLRRLHAAVTREDDHTA
jgi:hypothetical protein